MPTFKKTTLNKKNEKSPLKNSKKGHVRQAVKEEVFFENRFQLDIKHLWSTALGKFVFVLSAFLLGLALLLLFSGNLLDNFLFMSGIVLLVALCAFIFYLYVIHRPLDFKEGKENER